MLGSKDTKRRNRARTACIACQARKRKCSGTQPCTTCARLHSECHYTRSEPGTRPLEQSAGTRSPGIYTAAEESRAVRNKAIDQSNHEGQLRSVEANSGAAFARKLGLRIDPNLAPKLNMFAWNLGLRYTSSSLVETLSLPSTVNAPSILGIITPDELRFFAAVYFEKVDPYYPFIDRHEFFHRINKIENPEAVSHITSTPYEAILCGVAALGLLFSRRDPNNRESQLLETARLILERGLCCHSPSIDLITGWVLRVSYLRVAGIPHLAWLASCTLMHLIEAAGLHMELPVNNSLVAEPPDEASLDTRRRLFGISRHFNLWFSFELGRTRVTFPTTTTKLPETSEGPKNIFTFLGLSESLDPKQTHDIPMLEQALVDIMNIDDLSPPMILTQCNLMLCVHRRLQSLNVTISGGIFDQFLAIARQGLRAAEQMVISHSPWHQVANVPFQIVCALLSIDSDSSIALLPDAIKTLREVVTSYDTEVMREARNTAMLLVKLHQRRKERDAKALGAIIQSEPTPPEAANEISSSVAGPDLVNQSTDPSFWVDDAATLGLDDFYLDPLLMLDNPWPATSFEIG